MAKTREWTVTSAIVVLRFAAAQAAGATADLLSQLLPGGVFENNEGAEPAVSKDDGRFLA